MMWVHNPPTKACSKHRQSLKRPCSPGKCYWLWKCHCRRQGHPTKQQALCLGPLEQKPWKQDMVLGLKPHSKHGGVAPRTCCHWCHSWVTYHPHLVEFALQRKAWHGSLTLDGKHDSSRLARTGRAGWSTTGVARRRDGCTRVQFTVDVDWNLSLEQ
jgi:hypothetical protein